MSKIDAHPSLMYIDSCSQTTQGEPTPVTPLHQLVSPTIDVLRPQHQRSDRYCPRRHPTILGRVPPGRGRFRPTAHPPSGFRSHVFHQYLSDQDRLDTFTLPQPGVIWIKFAPCYGSRLEWRWARSVGWLGSLDSRLCLRTGVGDWRDG